MSDPAGSLNIHLRRSPAGLLCTIDSTRPVSAAAVFVGRTPEETAARLPLLFSVCSRAQAGACAGAFEQALGVTPSPCSRLRRAVTIATETSREHLWRILLDWPHLLGEPAERETMASVLALSNRIQSHLDPKGELFRVGGDASDILPPRVTQLAAELTDLLSRQVFGMSPAAWASEITNGAALEHWCTATTTGAARLLRSVFEADETRLGQTTVTELPEIPDAELIARLTGATAADFIARPTWEGQPRETSPFTRTLAIALIQSLIERHGRGLLARLAAQLLEVATALSWLSLDPGTRDHGTEGTAPAPDGIGLGRAQAARGQLIHLVRVTAGRVRDYRILAPTEWNFHPQGVVAQGLTALPPTSEAALRRQANLLITAIDPCVAFELQVS